MALNSWNRIRIKLQPLDRRMTAHDLFSHRLSFHGHNVLGIIKMAEVRDWLWDTYGPSSEVDYVRETHPDQIWSWEVSPTTDRPPRIYIKGPALTQYLLIKERFE